MEHNEIINMMHSNPAQSHVIAACQDNHLRLYTADPLTLLNTLEGHTASVTSALFTSNTAIASSDISGELILWRLEGNYTPYHRIKLNSSITLLSKHKENLLIAIEKRIEMLNLKTHEMTPFYQSDDVIVSLDCVGDHVVFCTENGTLNYLKEGTLSKTEKGNFKDAALNESLGLVCISAVGDKTVVFENDMRIEIEGKGDCVKWSTSGFCFVVGDMNECRCYGPDSNGKFREINIEESK